MARKLATLASRPRRAAGRVVLGWSIPRGPAAGALRIQVEEASGPWFGECHIPLVVHPSPCSETHCMQTKGMSFPARILEENIDHGTLHMLKFVVVRPHRHLEEKSATLPSMAASPRKTTGVLFQ